MAFDSDAAARLDATRTRKVPLILQAEAAECGLACLAMLAGAFGHDIDLATLRRRFPVSLKGATLARLIDCAARLDLGARPLRLELHELPLLRTPCILHWDLNHFVVLVRCRRGQLVVHDPARGERRLSLDEASPHFTGVALELWPRPGFEPRVERQAVALGRLLRDVDGLPRALGQILVLALALEICALVSPFFVQWVVDGAIVAADRDLLTLLALGFALLLLIQVAIGLARSWAVLHLTAHLSLRWNTGVFAHLLHLPAEWFERRHMGDIVSRFGAVGAIQRTLTTGTVEAVIDGVMAVATLAMMIWYSPLLAAIVAASLLAYALLRWAAYGPLRRAAEEQIVLNARASSLFMESVRAAVSIKLFGHEDERAARWANASVDAANRGLATERMTIGYRFAQTLLAGTEHIAVVCVGAVAVMDNTFSVGMLFAFVSYKTTFGGRCAALIDKAVQIRMLRLQAERLADIVLTPREDDGVAGRHVEAEGNRATRDRIAGAATSHHAHGVAQTPTAAQIELRAVSFRYGDGEPWALRNVSLAVLPGEVVALAGASGSGKTTLLKVLLGLLPPTEGEVRFGGIRLADLGLRRYREHVAAVLQDDHLLAGSIADNIAFFSMQPDHARIEACSRVALIHDDVMAMPMGYATLIGDMGSAVSGGQRQRILLARALYRGPRVLFLDEATSHLDLATEARVNAALAPLSITRIVAAHRPQALAAADRVLVIERGTIRQEVRTNHGRHGAAASPSRPHD